MPWSARGHSDWVSFGTNSWRYLHIERDCIDREKYIDINTGTDQDIFIGIERIIHI